MLDNLRKTFFFYYITQVHTILTVTTHVLTVRSRRMFAIFDTGPGSSHTHRHQHHQHYQYAHTTTLLTPQEGRIVVYLIRCSHTSVFFENSQADIIPHRWFCSWRRCKYNCFTVYNTFLAFRFNYISAANCKIIGAGWYWLENSRKKRLCDQTYGWVFFCLCLLKILGFFIIYFF